MKTITSLFIAGFLLISITTNAQSKKVKGNGKITTETRTVSNFDKIAVSGYFDVILVKGKEGNISIEASENLMESIETEVKDGLLKIKFKKGWNVRTSKEINITISYKDIEGVSLSGSGSVVSSDEIIANDFNLSVSGSGNMKLHVFTGNLKASISGSGNLKLSGETTNFTCGISGSGNLNASELKSDISTAKVSGSGNVKVHAIKEIHAKTSGSGNIIYSGNPTIVKATSSGSGSIQKRN